MITHRELGTLQQEGLLALLGGLTAQEGNPNSQFAAATKCFEIMGIEGGLEMARDYIDALGEERVQIQVGLFPEKTRLLSELNTAISIYNKVQSGGVELTEQRNAILEAVDHFRKVEVLLDGISPLDRFQRRDQAASMLRRWVAYLLAFVGLLFAILQAIVRLLGK